jgi:hypothetical protein
MSIGSGSAGVVCALISDEKPMKSIEIVILISLNY